LRTRTLLIPLALLLALCAYALPWVITFGSTGFNTSLSPGAYDLAEWASLAPTVQTESPPLLTAFLLRAPLACVGLLAAFAAPKQWLGGLAALVVAVALLPPLEFVRDPGNMNYRQQFALAAITFIGGLVAASAVLRRYHRWIALGIAMIGLVATAIGLMRGYELMLNFDLASVVGLGGIITGVSFGVAALLIAKNRGAGVRPRV
jgi:hypothetical protein